MNMDMTDPTGPVAFIAQSRQKSSSFDFRILFKSMWELTSVPRLGRAKFLPKIFPMLGINFFGRAFHRPARKCRLIRQTEMEDFVNTMLRIAPLSESPLETAFDDLVRRTIGETSWTPAADIAMDGADALITLEVPGLSDGQVELEVRDRALHVRGSRDAAHVGDPDSAVKLMRQEIRRGAFSRTFRLPAHITAEAISASYDAGMLTIRIADASPAPVSQTVQISGLAPSQAVAAVESEAITA